MYEFYIAQSILEETLNAKSLALDENTTKLQYGFLAFDLDILRMVGSHVMEVPLELQYTLYFEVWYKSILLSRKIKTENITDK